MPEGELSYAVSGPHKHRRDKIHAFMLNVMSSCVLFKTNRQESKICYCFKCLYASEFYEIPITIKRLSLPCKAAKNASRF